MSHTDGAIERRDFVKMAGAGAASLAVAGCTGDEDGADDGGDDNDGGDDTTDGGDSTGGSAPTENEIIHIEDQTQGSIDPARMSDTIENTMRSHLYDELVAVDAETFSAVEFIATEWRTDDEGQTWEFTIRDDVPKHGGGMLTAEDVAYSMDRQIDIGAGYGAFWTGRLGVGDTEAVGDTEVRFNFDQTYGPFIATLARFAVVDKDLLQEHENDGDWGQDWLEQGNTAGTGPYRIDRFTTSDVTELVAFDDYWRGWEDNQFGRVRIEIIEEASTGMQKMQLGEAHVYNGNLTMDNWEQLDSYDGVELREDPMARLYFMHLNTTKEPFDDPKVREAFFYSVNYQSVVDDIIGGGQRAAGPVPRPMGEFHNPDVPVSEQDPDRAQAALEDASYTASEISDLGVEIWPMSGNPVFEQTALLVQDNLQEVLGVEVDINVTPWSNIAEAYSSAESTPHMFMSYNSAKFPSPITHTDFMYHPSAQGSYGNAHWYEDDELTELLDAAATEPDREQRIEHYHEIQSYVYDLYLNMFFANPLNRLGLSTDVGGYEYTTVVSNTASYPLYLEK